MNTQFFVNHKTRICQALSGHPENPEHQKNISEAIKQGFIEVSGDEMDSFRADTRAAVEAGWRAGGRVSYAKFISMHMVKP